MRNVIITKTKLAGANKSKKGNGFVIVENGVLCYIPERLVALVDSFEIESIEFEETSNKTDSGISLGNLSKINESKIGQNKLKEAELRSDFAVMKLQKEIAKLEKEEV